MSVEGSVAHNKYGCDDGDTLNITPIVKIEHNEYEINSNVILTDSTCENIEYINNSIQDGFQSEILCSLVCDTSLPAEDLGIGENVRLHDGENIDSETQNKFTDALETQFSGKISSIPSMESLAPSLDEQIDNFLLSDEYKIVNKAHSDDVTQSLEEQQKTVNEAISAIAKSFGLEDLLPDTFQIEGNKDVLSVTVAPNDLVCDDENNIETISMSDFEKSPVGLTAPDSPLDLTGSIDEESDYILNGLELLVPSSSKSQLLETNVKSKRNKKSSNSQLESESKKCVINAETPFSNNLSFDKDGSVENISNLYEFEQPESKEKQIEIPETNDELANDIPTVRIPDVIENELNSQLTNCPSVGPATVLITRDKVCKKMQIVLTLDLGQQIYDIDTNNLDAAANLEILETNNDQETLQTETQEPLALGNIVTNEPEQLNIESNKSMHIDDDVNGIDASNLMSFVQKISVSKSKKDKTWVCPVEDCGHVLNKSCKIRVHMNTHKGARPFKCNFDGCDWAFTTPYRLRRHVETHLGFKDYICDFEGCNRKFTTVYNLKTHKKRHKWPNSLTCPAKDCKLSFANRRKMELHLRVHKDVEAPYKCTLCGKQYYSANCIASHYRTHQYNEDDFKCPFAGCGKRYDKICRLKQHVRHHTGERPYACPADGCKWSFMSASKLTRHMRKHTGERKFVCTEPGCGKSFMRPEHLKGHVVIHSGDKPFHCPHENCNAQFTAKSSLYVHVKKHCPSVLKVVYPCPVTPCVKKYNSKATLKQHVQKFHPQTLQDGKQLDISEKLELTMPVSVVNKDSENTFDFLELDENIADDPLSSKIFLSKDQTSDINGVSSNLDQIPLKIIKTSSVTKSNKNDNLNSEGTSFKDSNKGNESYLSCGRLLQENHSGSARTDYCCNHVFESKLKWLAHNNSTNLNSTNSDNQDTKSLLSNQTSDELNSSDVMLTSSIIFQDQTSDHLVKSNFLQDETSTAHSLYHEDSILTTSAFGTDLIMPVSLLSDNGENDSSEVIFTVQNDDAFADTALALQGLD